MTFLITGLSLGGAESQATQLAAELQRRGYETALISLRRPDVVSAELDQAGVALHSLDIEPRSRDALAGLRLMRLLQRLRPQILHAHLFHANLAARLIRLVVPAPLVISTLHSMAESSRTSSSVVWRDRLYRFTAALADATVAVSEAVAARHRQARAVSPRRLHVIPNGIHTARYRPRRVVAGARFRWLAVGRLMWKKDYPTMLAAFARAGGVLRIAGEGPEEAVLRELATGMQVEFLGSRSDIPALMESSDALVLSSRVEGLPVVLLEAAASGLPCVATDVGGVREAVVDGRTGFLAPPGNAGALAESMQRLMTLPIEEREAMGRAARAHAESNFDWQILAPRWESLYRELLERNS